MLRSIFLLFCSGLIVSADWDTTASRAQIAVSPGAINETLAAGQNTTHHLTITNTASDPLDVQVSVTLDRNREPNRDYLLSEPEPFAATSGRRYNSMVIDATGQVYCSFFNDNRLYRYDPQTDTAEAIENTPYLDYYDRHFTRYHNGKIYVVSHYHNVIDIYDIAANSWSQVDANFSIYGMTSGDDGLYLIGREHFARLNHASSAMETLDHFPLNYSSMANLVVIDDHVYAQVMWSSYFYRYSIADDTWETLSQSPEHARFGAVTHASLYIALAEDDIIYYDLIDGSWKDTQGTTPPYIENMIFHDGYLYLINQQEIQRVRLMSKWLEVDRETLTVPANESASLGVILNTSFVEQGAHTGHIVLTSNDPLNPNVTVPVTLNMSGGGSLGFIPGQVDFGDLYLGDSVTREVQLVNDGDDTVLISHIEVDHPTISASTPPGQLEPGEWHQLTLLCTPTEAGAITATLTLSFGSNTVTLPLSANPQLPPEMTLTPEAFNESLATGETVTDALVITNSGESPLQITLAVDDTHHVVQEDLSTPPHDIERPVVDPLTGLLYAKQRYRTDFYRYDPVVNVWEALSPSTIDSNIQFATWLDGKIYHLFNDRDLMAIYHIATDHWEYEVALFNAIAMTADDQYLYLVDQDHQWHRYDPPNRRFELQGSLPDTYSYRRSLAYHQGHLYYLSDRSFARLELNTTNWEDLTLPQNVSLQPHYATMVDGLWIVRGSNDNALLFDTERLSWNEDHLLIPPSTSIAAAHHGWLYLTGYSGTFQRIDYRSPLISLAEQAATIPANDTWTVPVTFNTRLREAGTYEETIIIGSDDPQAREVRIPVTLTVSGSALMVVSPGALDFGETTSGLPLVRELVFANPGMDLLQITNITSGNAAFSVQTTGFSITPGGHHALPVTFAPTTNGTVTGSLTVTTDHGNETVPLSGSAISGPAIDIAPAGIIEGMVSGEQRDLTLTISNNGSQPLTMHFGLDESPASAALSSPDAPHGTVPVPAQLPTSPQEPRHLFVDESGTLYSLDQSGSFISSYSHLTGQWSRIIEIAEASSNYRPVWHGQKLYMLISQSGTLRIYDQPSQQWSTLAIDSDYEIVAAGPAGIFLLGDDFFARLNPDDHSIETLTPPDFYNYGQLAMTVLDDLIYCHQDRQFQRYDVTSDSWTQLPNPPETPSYQAVMVNGRYLVPENYDEGLMVFHISDNTWRTESGPDLRLNSLAGHRGVLYSIPRYDDAVFSFPAPLEWGSIDRSSLTVGPGEQGQITVSLSAYLRAGGSYQADLVVKSNDTATPEWVVPIQLDITDGVLPIVEPGSLDFGSHHVGHTGSQALTITNLGNQTLDIRSIASDNSVFTVDTNVLAVPAGETRDLNVLFSPDTVATEFGVLTLSAGETIEVAMVGQGTAPPVMTVNHGQLDFLLEAGESTTATFTIGNTGSNDLHVRLNGQRPAQMRAFNLNPLTYGRESAEDEGETRQSQRLDGGDILRGNYHDLTDLRIAYNGSSINHATLFADLRSRGATIESLYPSSVDFSEYHLVWLADPSGYWPPETIENLQQWMAGGGSLLITGEDSTDLYNRILPATCGISFGPALDYLDLETRDILAHTTTEGVSLIQLPSCGGNMTVEAPASVLMNYDDDSQRVGLPLAAASSYGQGRIIALSNEMLSDTSLYSGDNQHFGNQVIGFLYSQAPWLGFSDDQLVIPPGTTVEITLTVDATTLYAGTYPAEILVTGNDPLNPTVSIPVDLQVSGLPGLLLEEDEIDFGEVGIGSDTTRYISLTNTGHDVLTINQLTIDNDVFTLDAPISTVPPGTTYSLRLRFTPTGAGSENGTLTIDSNAGIASIALRGEGLELPQIMAGSDTIDVSLPPGQTGTASFTISNVGAGPMDLNLVAGTVLLIGDGSSEEVITPLLQQSGMGVTLVDDDSIYEGYPSARNYDVTVLLASDSGDDMPDYGQSSISRALNYDDKGLVAFEWLAFEISQGRYSQLAPYIPVSRDHATAGSVRFTVNDHPLTRGLPDAFTLDTATNVGSASFGDVLVGDDQGGDAVVAAENQGGRVVQFSTPARWDTYEPLANQHMQQLFRNAVKWAADQWMSVIPYQLSMQGNTLQTIQLAFDTTDMVPGEVYQTTLRVLSNDPNNSTFTIPVTLEVSCALDQSFYESLEQWPDNTILDLVSVVDTACR